MKSQDRKRVCNNSGDDFGSPIFGLILLGIFLCLIGMAC